MYHRKVRRVIRKSNMLDKNDKIMVACSGGKDSMSLLHLLAKKRFDITAVTINEGTTYRSKCAKIVSKFCKELEIPHVVKTFKEEYSITASQIAKKKLPLKACSYCGVLRRNLINKTARELKVDKVATGHNLDDEAQTILMNLYRSELKRLARGGAIVGMMKHKKFIPRIKPLRECLGRENIIFALHNNISFESFGCPYREVAYRNIIRKQLNEMEHSYPGTKISLLHNFDRLLPHLKKAFKEKKADTCIKCGEISSGDVCKTCQLVKNIESVR